MITLDLFKVLVLCTFLLLCIYDGGVKLLGNINRELTLSVPTNDQFCKQYKGDKLESCKSMTKLAYDDANIRCHKYIDVLHFCKKARKNCSNLESNLNSCVVTVLKDRITVWESSHKT